MVQGGDVDLLPDVSICCSWNSRFFLFVVRNIDQLSDGKGDLLVLVSTGRTVQCKLLTDVFDSGRTVQVQT